MILMNKILQSGLQDTISRTMYTIINGKIEKSTELLSEIMIKIVIPMGLLPPIISTIVNYCYFDLGNESFIMPCPMMYVSEK